MIILILTWKTVVKNRRLTHQYKEKMKKKLSIVLWFTQGMKIILLLVLFYSRGRDTSQKHIKNHKKVVCSMTVSLDNLQGYSSLTCIVHWDSNCDVILRSVNKPWDGWFFWGSFLDIHIRRVAFYTISGFSWLVFNSSDWWELTHLGQQQSRDLNLELRHPKWHWNIHQICLADPANILLSGWRELVFPLTLPPLKSTSFHLKKFCWNFWMPCSDHHVYTHLICLSYKTVWKILP